MLLNYHQFNLPIANVVDAVRMHLNNEHTAIVHAPPGAGKSTLLPLTLLEQPWLNNKKILMLEPRRLAAKTIAMRMADMIGQEVGQQIGYRIRFEQKISAQTKLEVVTEGILTRLLQHDNELSQYGLIIFDEFHERSLHADLALALCRESQQILRPDLRILIMSATLNTEHLGKLLNTTPITSLGKQFNVDIKYTGQTDYTLLPELCARVVLQASKENEGDILVFLPGESEIKRTADILNKELPGFNIHPLYGLLPHSAQMAAILPNKQNQRKVVLATSIAETSLTIENITVVIDSGFSRVSRFDPKSGLSRLETIPITQDSAIQRAGRAGRLAAGICYRMYTKATFNKLIEHRVPEIEEADLTAFMLELFVWGISEITNLTWITPPPIQTTKLAIALLEELNAIENNKVTPHGKALHQLPCHPRLAHLLLKAKHDEVPALGCDIAAILEERDPLPKESGIDINFRIEWLRRAREANKVGGKLAKIEKNAAQYRNLLGVDIDNSIVDAYETGLLLAYAYPERIACARIGNNAQFQLANGKIAVAGHKDDLANEPWLAIAHMDARDGLGKIFMAAPLNPKDLVSMVKERETVGWDSRKGGVVATKELRIGNIVLKSTPIKNPNEQLIKQAILQEIKNNGTELLNFDHDVLQLINRINSLHNWNKSDNWPALNQATLLAQADVWLSPFLVQIKKPEDLKRINLTESILSWLGWEKSNALDALAPAKIKVPSGSFIPIQYQADGGLPILAVRLQEIFGMTTTPLINSGKTALVIHLLSPGFKPVQVTTDLNSFWQNTYFEVKKELQRRYPKHAWPENPLDALPVAKGGVRRI